MGVCNVASVVLIVLMASLGVSPAGAQPGQRSASRSGAAASQRRSLTSPSLSSSMQRGARQPAAASPGRQAGSPMASISGATRSSAAGAKRNRPSVSPSNPDQWQANVGRVNARRSSVGGIQPGGSARSRPWDPAPLDQRRPNININRPNVGINRPVINNTVINNNTIINNNTVVNNVNRATNVRRNDYARGYRRPPYYSSLHYQWGPSSWSRYAYRPAYQNYYSYQSYGAGLVLGGAPIGFTNPFWAAPAVGLTVWDYSRPIPVPDIRAPESPADLVRSEQAVRVFDKARDMFRQGQYAAAEQLVDRAIELLPGDPTMHQFRALALFGSGKFTEAAATIYAVLAVSPGWDWDTIGSLYSDPQAYEAQFHQLAQYVRDHPDRNDAKFLLAYHCLVLGEDRVAANLLIALRIANPEDRVATGLLSAIQNAP